MKECEGCKSLREELEKARTELAEYKKNRPVRTRVVHQDSCDESSFDGGFDSGIGWGPGHG